jgi:hypothetical protein
MQLSRFSGRIIYYFKRIFWTYVLVILKNAVFRNVTPCGTCELPVIAKVFSSWSLLSTLMMDADDVNLIEDNIGTVNKSTETLIDASKEVGLEVNVEKTKYMLVSRDQIAGQNRETDYLKMCHSSSIWERQ